MYIYIQIHTNIYIRTYISIRICIYIYIYIHIHMCIYIHIHLHIRMYTCIHLQLLTHLSLHRGSSNGATCNRNVPAHPHHTAGGGNFSHAVCCGTRVARHTGAANTHGARVHTARRCCVPGKRRISVGAPAQHCGRPAAARLPR